MSVACHTNCHPTVLAGPAAPDETALELEREKVRHEYEEQVKALQREKEVEEQSKQAMQAEVDALRMKLEEELAQVAEKARLQV